MGISENTYVENLFPTKKCYFLATVYTAACARVLLLECACLF